MTPITTRAKVAAAVAALREVDAKNRTDLAIATVADTLHLDPAEVAAIATEESHEDALREDRERALRAVSARSMGITPELADAPGCRGCGACKREAIPA